MRIAAVSILLLLAGAGCARSPKPMPSGVDRYGDGAASSLAFDPPVIADEPRLELSRADRGPSAFVGYEDIITTHFYLRTDDHQRWFDDDGGQFQRRSISEKYGTRYR